MNISSVHIIISVFIIIMTSNDNSDALLKSVLDPKALLKIHEDQLRTQKKQRAEKSVQGDVINTQQWMPKREVRKTRNDGPGTLQWT